MNGNAVATIISE